MLFLVISTPQPQEMTEELVKTRLAFRDWIRDLKSIGKVICFYPREGRGSVVMFNIGLKDELDTLLEKWKTYVSVKFDIYPLQEPEAAESSLRGVSAKERGVEDEEATNAERRIEKCTK